MDIVTKEILPPETSMSGKNTCYLHCPALNRRSNYGVCLFTLRAQERGALTPESDCNAAICSGQCVARDYRAQELNENRALYFRAREQIAVKQAETPTSSSTPKNINAFRRGQQMVDRREKTSVRAPEKKKTDQNDFTQHLSGTLSDAVESAMKRSHETDHNSNMKLRIEAQLKQSKLLQEPRP